MTQRRPISGYYADPTATEAVRRVTQQEQLRFRRESDWYYRRASRALRAQWAQMAEKAERPRVCTSEAFTTRPAATERHGCNTDGA